MSAYAEYNFIAYSTKSVLTTSFSPYVALHELRPTFLGRLENFMLHVIDYIYYSYIIFPEMDKIVSSSFKNLPPLIELAERSIITMFNYDAAIDGMIVTQIHLLVINQIFNLRCATATTKCYRCRRITNRRTENFNWGMFSTVIWIISH